MASSFFTTKEHVRSLIFDALKGTGVKELGRDDIVLEPAPAYTDADYATNVAFIVAKYKGTSPRGVADNLVKTLKSHLDPKGMLAGVEAAGAGFLNFRLSEEWLKAGLFEALDAGEDFGRGDLHTNKNIIIEFADPNPFKEFHVGHLYSNTVGEALARLMEWQGGEVKRANYYGDVGIHVAKAIWGVEGMMRQEGHALGDLEKKALKERIAFWGRGYAKGAQAFEEDEQAKREMVSLNLRLYQKDSTIQELYAKGKAWSLEYFETIYKRLGTRFDYYFPESEVAGRGLALVHEYEKKGIFEKSQGAIVFPGERHGLHTRVVVNSIGLPTYEAKELGLAFLKQEMFPYDQSIIITANEVDSYFRVILCALHEIDPELAKETRHLSHGMVRLPEGKMSSRKGNVVTGESLLDEAKERALYLIESSSEQKKIKEKKEKDEIAEKVAVAAVKYALLKHALGHDIVFSFEDSVTFEGDSGPYLQYTYARTQSILARSQKPKDSQWSTLNEDELAMARILLRFPDTALSVAKNNAPSGLCAFLFGAAKKFNAFYDRHRIVGSNEEAQRIGLTRLTAHVVKMGLYLLGIQAPETM